VRRALRVESGIRVLMVIACFPCLAGFLKKS
jgi:hypothetical protein